MNKKQHNQQAGFVSIIVASLLMIILSLIVIGFTKIMQREQRQALDRQLSRQALYAAESGVNDVLGAISAGQVGYTNPTKTNCDPTNLGPYNNGNLVSATDDTVAYTCAMYDKEPSTLDYKVSDSESKTVMLENATTNNFNTFKIEWGQGDDPPQNDISSLANCSSAGNFNDHPDVRPSAVPILKVDLTRLGPSTAGGNGFVRSQMIEQTDYMYLTPCQDPPGTSHPFRVDTFSGTNSRGIIVPVACDTTPGVSLPCSVNITELTNGLAPYNNTGSDRYFLRMRPIYAAANVNISATELVAGLPTPTSFKNGQVAIDVTARASDVVRRLRVSVPMSESNVEVPEFAIQSFDGICKLLTVTATTVTDNCLPGGGFGPVPAGDGYVPTVLGSRIYNMFHHREGLVVVCHNTNLTDCGYAEETNHISTQNPVLVPFNNKLYFPAQEMAGAGTHNIVIGCFNIATSSFCPDYAVLDATNYVSSAAASPLNNFHAGISGLAEINGRLYTIGVDGSGNERIYCALPTATGAVACPGFVPVDIGLDVTPGNMWFLMARLEASGNRLLFGVNGTTTPNYWLGCFDTTTLGQCGGWPSLMFDSGVDNHMWIRVGSKMCTYDGPEYRPVAPPPNFDVRCYESANGSATAVPANFMSQPRPALAFLFNPVTNENSSWSAWEPSYIGTKIYFSASTFMSFPDSYAMLYCYDTSIPGVCNGWGGDNGWQEGSSGGNYFGTNILYGVGQQGSCLYGIMDNGTPPIRKLSPTNAGVCP